MKKSLWLACLMLSALSCKKEETTPNNSISLPSIEEADQWLIPVSEIKDGGVGKDGIKSIDEPIHISAQQASFMNDDDLILGFKYNETVIAYPQKILDYHEIINDKIDDFAFSISYCPLTGSGLLYDRSLDGVETTFGVSGLLYNSNLILYDRGSGSLWSQMLLKSINGSKMTAENGFHQLVETTWGNWRSWYPGTKVLSVEGLEVQPDYDVYPYGDYKTNNDNLLFGVANNLSDIPKKERILGIKVGGEVGYVQFKTFGQLNSQLVREIGGEEVLVFGSEKDNYMLAYLAKTTEGDIIRFRKSLMGTGGGLLFEDTQGNAWDFFGTAVSGDREGEQLVIPTHFMGYAFAWAAFYPDFFTGSN
ncbi:DUF3179 domain-containing protein [Jiulongibacter sediminis]|uniref:DUF3179 domain-containing protein n=1 Tax=Jiulongibacter sediminis TaxID=1605367 RepID=UPI0026EE8F74|nr:DUF3179 domain-containing protein [Jiulongibacter sediminis]